MTLQKICDVCGMANPATEMICQRCFSDISRKKPVNSRTPHIEKIIPGLKKQPVFHRETLELDQDKTIREVAPLVLNMSPGQTITVRHGDTIGRDGVGGRILNQFSAVSRHHATFKYFNGRWLVRDENSTNGTYINGTKIGPDKWYELRQKDTLSISSACTFTIQ
jgi:pSer/pThr/pTyr-binding forkhead associated (FHA) protein